MKVYVKELGRNEDENIQVLNTSTDKFFMPRVGDSVLVSYVVVRVDWISFRSGNETAVLWVTKKSGNQVKVSIVERLKDGIWKTKDRELDVVSLDRTKLPKILIGESMEIDGKVYKVSDVIKVGGFFDFRELKVIVYEVSG